MLYGRTYIYAVCAEVDLMEMITTKYQNNLYVMQAIRLIRSLTLVDVRSRFRIYLGFPQRKSTFFFISFNHLITSFFELKGCVRDIKHSRWHQNTSEFYFF